MPKRMRSTAGISEAMSCLPIRRTGGSEWFACNRPRHDWSRRLERRGLEAATSGAGEGATPRPRNPSLRERMERKLRAKQGAAPYSKRGWAVEPVFRHIKHVRGCVCFMRRARRRCQ